MNDYLSFGRKDRIGLLCLIFLIGIIYGLPHFFAKKSDTPFVIASPNVRTKDSTLIKYQPGTNTQTYSEGDFDFNSEPVPPAHYPQIELFTFDPNTLSIAGWQKLGLNNRIIKTIDHYRSKGGKFYKPEDVKKIWGLPEAFYNRVKDYILIPSSHPDFSTASYTPSPKWEKEEKKIFQININEADTSAFIALPGIGSKLANRIVNFREKLGGFYSLDQIGETYGLPDSTFQKIKPRLKITITINKQININTATKEELKAHPYIRWNIANAIVEYRNQHGSFGTVDDLKKIMLIDEAAFSRMLPYLVAE